MNKLMMVAGAALVAVAMTGCATGKAGEDKVGNWQKERTPVEVLKSQISVKAAGAVVEALDVAPFGIYKAIADKVDGAAAIDRSRRSYQMYIGSIKEAMEQGKSKEEAVKQANAELNAAPDSAKLKADIKRARANNWIILIAVHEPLCTRNPANKDTQPYMKGDPDIDTNFFDHRCCRPGHKEASDAVSDLIVNNADVVRGVFNGHEHSAYYTWFNGTYTDASGNKVEKSIPQHTVTCCIYRSGCLALITVK